jgi:hypothetical protein
MKHIKLFEEISYQAGRRNIVNIGDLTEEMIKPGLRVITYHSSPEYLRITDTPIHLGTSEQTDSRVDSLWNDYPMFYEFKVTIRLTNPFPYIIRDVDLGANHETSDFTKYGDYSEFVYHNSVEGYPDELDNISIFVLNLKRSQGHISLLDVIRTTGQ